MHNTTPIHEHTIALCDCRGGTDYRGQVVVFYERDTEGWVRCRECGTIPPEIVAPIPPEHHVRLTIYHEVDAKITRKFAEYMPPTAGENAACPECEAEGVADRGVATDKQIEDGRLVYRCTECGRKLASGGPA